MRKINWDEKLSDADIAWLRQAGFMSEERIANHQAQFDADVPDDEVPNDALTRDALNPGARVATPVEGTGAGSPALVDPTEEVPADDEGDDYESWKVSDLDDEIKARNQIEGATPVEVVGTGSGGNVTKPDLVKAMRLWDDQNPGVLDDE